MVLRVYFYEVITKLTLFFTRPTIYILMQFKESELINKQKQMPPAAPFSVRPAALSEVTIWSFGGTAASWLVAPHGAIKDEKRCVIKFLWTN